MDQEVVNADAERRYSEALESEQALREYWVDMGSPLLTNNRFGDPIVHPLVSEVRAAQAHASRMARAFAVKRPVGRPKGSESAPDRDAGRPGILRSVK